MDSVVQGPLINILYLWMDQFQHMFIFVVVTHDHVGNNGIGQGLKLGFVSGPRNIVDFALDKHHIIVDQKYYTKAIKHPFVV